MSLGKSKCWFSNNCLDFKGAVPWAYLHSHHSCLGEKFRHGDRINSDRISTDKMSTTKSQVTESQLGIKKTESCH